MADFDPGVESSSLPGSMRKAGGRSCSVRLELLCHDHGAQCAAWPRNLTW